MKKKDEFAVYYTSNNLKSMLGIAFNSYNVKTLVEENGAFYENIEIKNRATKKTYNYFEFLEEFDK